MQVYIKGKSKAEINRRLQSGVSVMCMEFGMGRTEHHRFKDLPVGTTIKVFEKTVGGQPYAKSYGVKKDNVTIK